MPKEETNLDFGMLGCHDRPLPRASWPQAPRSQRAPQTPSKAPELAQATASEPTSADDEGTQKVFDADRLL